jgi:hypothetical protein
MARKQTTASQRQLLENTLSTLATLITDLAPQAQVEMTFEQCEDTNMHTSMSTRLVTCLRKTLSALN